MNDRTADDLFNRFAELLAASNARIDSRFDAIDSRFDAIDSRFDGIDSRVSRLETKFDA